MDILSYTLGKKAGGGGGTINNQDKTVTQNGSYTADAGYTGLGTVTVDVETPAPNLQNKNVTITENTTTNISADSGYDGLGQVSVTTNVPTGGGSIDWSEIGYSGEPQSIQDGFDYAKDIYDNWDNTQTDLSYKFQTDNNLIYMPLVNTSNATDMKSMFNSSKTLQLIPNLDTSNVTTMQSMMNNCSSLHTISELNALNTAKIRSTFYGCNNLKNLGGLLNLGQAYLTTASADYSDYRLELSSSPLLTHDSLMNVINKLYDIATKGCNVQQLVLGSTNLAKLTAEEIAIATNKGWTVS